VMDAARAHAGDATDPASALADAGRRR
jgi:hypothetical protein